MKIVLYTQKGCPNCKRLKERLDSKNINYVENNNEKEMIEKGFDFLPVLEVDDDIMDFKKAIKWLGDN